MSYQSIKNKEKLLELASNLNKFISEHGWVSRYDVESDSLSITKSELSSDARIRYFDNEVAIYLTDEGDIEGLFIEYFKSNFVSHHEDLKKVMNDIEKDEKKNSSSVQLSRKEVNKITPDIERALKSSLAEKLNVKTT